MANLYLTEQESILRKTGSRLIVEKDEQILLDVQCHKINAVLIFGNVQFTTQAVNELLKNGIEMAILTRTGRLRGQITSPATKNVRLRIKQYEKYWDEEFKLGLSKTIVTGKIINCLNLIRIFSYNHTEIEFSEEKNSLESYISKIEEAKNTNELMGIEGIAAKNYFKGFRKMILSDFIFPGRRKHPSTDPVNALLSLGYTMVYNEILSLLDGLGFDPYLGYFHQILYGRASLAGDLQEEFRASVDRFTLYLVNNNIFEKSDFSLHQKSGGVFLHKEALKRYFKEYEENTNKEFKHPETGETTTLRKCFRLQSQKLSGYITKGNPYTPFKLEY